MNGVRIHGSIDLLGADTEIHNFELETLTNDTADMSVGALYFNKNLARARYIESITGSPVIRSIAHMDDVVLLQSDINLKASLSDINSLRSISVVNNTTNNLLFGQPVCMVSGNTIDAGNASDINKKDIVGFVTDTILGNGGVGTIYSFGNIIGTIAQWGMVVDGGLIPNTKYFLDINSGKMTSVVPSGNNQYLCMLGTAISETIFSIKIEKTIAL
jgi:hypothetical protein